MNVTLRRVRVPIFAVEKQKILHILKRVRNSSYPAFKAQTPYSHLWPTRLYHIFPHYPINGTISREKSS